MKKFLVVIAILLLPGGIIVVVFRLWQNSRKYLAEIFSRLKERILS